jgi:hypothetical protein
MEAASCSAAAIAKTLRGTVLPLADKKWQPTTASFVCSYGMSQTCLPKCLQNFIRCQLAASVSVKCLEAVLHVDKKEMQPLELIIAQ